MAFESSGGVFKKGMRTAPVMLLNAPRRCGLAQPPQLTGTLHPINDSRVGPRTNRGKRF